MLAQVPRDLWPLVTAHLWMHERLALGLVCRELRFLAGWCAHADFGQAVSKHYVGVQIRHLHDEWAELRRMRAAGIVVVHAPTRVSRFMLGNAAAKKGVADSLLWHDVLQGVRWLGRAPDHAVEDPM